MLALQAHGIAPRRSRSRGPHADDVLPAPRGRAFHEADTKDRRWRHDRPRQTWQVTLRYLRVIARQPAFLFIALVQPIIWLLLFGALFKAVTEIPGFAGGSTSTSSPRASW